MHAARPCAELLALYWQVVNMLLEQGVEVNVTSKNHQTIRPLHWAALRCVSHVTWFLIVVSRAVYFGIGAA